MQKILKSNRMFWYNRYKHLRNYIKAMINKRKKKTIKELFPRKHKIL